jgi:K+-transporting ATPase ATPase C chain
MLKHVRANLWLLFLTLVLCSGLYPLALWAVGRTAFRAQADGSLLPGKDGPAVGSRLIAQPFGGEEYFWPRPSAASYNASASGASNYGASNYLLRDRVARTLGPLVKYKDPPPRGKTVQEDVREWFKTKTQPGIVAEWAEAHPEVAQAWVNADDKHKDAVTEWQKRHPDAVAAWKKENPDGGEPKPADLAVSFFKSNAAAFHKEWPKRIDDPTWSLEAVFFDAWWQDPANAEKAAKVVQVPADLVMASGSGLDPHVTLAGAKYQLYRVVPAWAKKTGVKEETVRQEIEKLLQEKAESPLGGLAGVPLINVLEVNLALRERMDRLAK